MAERRAGKAEGPTEPAGGQRQSAGVRRQALQDSAESGLGIFAVFDEDLCRAREPAAGTTAQGDGLDCLRADVQAHQSGRSAPFLGGSARRRGLAVEQLCGVALGHASLLPVRGRL